MRGVTYFSYKGHVFDLLTQEYDVVTDYWTIKVTTVELERHFNGTGKASVYEEAAQAAVKNCIEMAKKSQVSLDFES